MEPLSALSTIAGIVPSVWDTIARIQNLKINKDGILIAYRYEVGANRALLRELVMENLKESTISDPSFRNFIENLQTQIGATILYDSTRDFYHDFCKSLNGKKLPKPFAGETDDDKDQKISTLFAAMRFSVNKIELLKRLASSARDGDALFHDFLLKKRIENIQTALLTIKEALADLKV